MKQRTLTVIGPEGNDPVELCSCDGSLQAVNQCRLTSHQLDNLKFSPEDMLLQNDEDDNNKIKKDDIEVLAAEKMQCAAMAFYEIMKHVKQEYEFLYEKKDKK